MLIVGDVVDVSSLEQRASPVNMQAWLLCRHAPLQSNDVKETEPNLVVRCVMGHSVDVSSLEQRGRSLCTHIGVPDVLPDSFLVVNGVVDSSCLTSI